MIYKITNPDILINDLIRDTMIDKIIWIKMGLGISEKYCVLIDIHGTTKYLKIDVNYEYIKIEFFVKGQKTSFELIDGYKKQREELIHVIKKQVG